MAVSTSQNLQQVAHIMQVADRLGVLGLRDASALSCTLWMNWFLCGKRVDDSQNVQVEEILRFAKATGADLVVWVRLGHFLPSNNKYTSRLMS